MNTRETYIGAFTASMILFLTGFMALFQQNESLVVGDIKQGTWILMGVGAALSFLKDFQALWSRRQIAKLTGSGNVHSYALLLVAPLLIVLLMTSGCAVNRPNIDSVNDAIVVSYADIETAATELEALCGNVIVLGDCPPGALISTNTRDRVGDILRDALDFTDAANAALIAGDSVGADNKLARADAVLRLVQTLLQERSP